MLQHNSPESSQLSVPAIAELAASTSDGNDSFRFEESIQLRLFIIRAHLENGLIQRLLLFVGCCSCGRGWHSLLASMSFCWFGGGTGF